MFSLKKLKQEIIKEVNKHLPPQLRVEADILEYPPNPEMGDIALPCFQLVKSIKIQEFKNKLENFAAKNPYIKEIKVVGSYLNFVLDKEKIFKEIQTKKPKSKIQNLKSKIIIEYISPNSNKPLHLGHVRNGLIGEAISNILERAGAKVVRACLVNDRGIHVAKSMLAYLKFGKGKKPSTAEKGDVFVGKYYVLFNEKAKKDPSLEKQAYELLKKWEAGDKKTIALWKKMTEWALDGHKETYKKLGICFDKIYFESQIYKKGRERILRHLKFRESDSQKGVGLPKPVFEKDDKENIIANLEKYGLPNKVVLRADGTAVYATTDIELAYKREKDFSFDELIYVVASEQDLYFKQLFKIFELLGAPFAKKLKHLNHGLVLLPEGKLKSREGTTVEADNLIEQLEKMTEEEIKKRIETKIPNFCPFGTSPVGRQFLISNKNPKSKICPFGTSPAGRQNPKSNIKKRATALALAALKFYILQVDPKSDTLFKPKESISLAGRTGVYLEYAYARINSILAKSASPISPIGLPRSEPKVLLRGPTGPISLPGSEPEVLLPGPIEEELVMHIIKFDEILESAAFNLDPSGAALYLYELAKKFNDFYEKVPVLQAPKSERTQRILLIKKIAKILKEGMGLLGIKALKRV